MFLYVTTLRDEKSGLLSLWNQEDSTETVGGVEVGPKTGELISYQPFGD